MTRPSCTATVRMGPTSISTPVVEERPAKQCPPLRTASPGPDRRAIAIASATSAAEVQAAAREVVSAALG